MTTDSSQTDILEHVQSLKADILKNVQSSEAAILEHVQSFEADTLEHVQDHCQSDSEDTISNVIAHTFWKSAGEDGKDLDACKSVKVSIMYTYSYRLMYHLLHLKCMNVADAVSNGFDHRECCHLRALLRKRTKEDVSQYILGFESLNSDVPVNFKPLSI